MGNFYTLYLIEGKSKIFLPIHSARKAANLRQEHFSTLLELKDYIPELLTLIIFRFRMQAAFYGRLQKIEFWGN